MARERNALAFGLWIEEVCYRKKKNEFDQAFIANEGGWEGGKQVGRSVDKLEQWPLMRRRKVLSTCG